MDSFIYWRFPAAFRARIRLFRFARATTLIEIAVYKILRVSCSAVLYFSLFTKNLKMFFLGPRGPTRLSRIDKLQCSCTLLKDRGFSVDIQVRNSAF